MPRTAPAPAATAGKRKPAGPIGRPKGKGSQLIYEALQQRILMMEMPPGSGIDEVALVAEFGVSRTPVREALIRLATEGFVSLLPNRGASVSPLDIDEIPELLEAMELCMRVTSRWAARRRTEADLKQMRETEAVLEEASHRDDYLAMSEANSTFHLNVAKAARNRHMIKLFKSLLPQYHRLSLALLSSAKHSSPVYKDYFGRVHDEHRGLIEAIEAGDHAAADTLARAHIRLIGERLQTYIWGWSSLADSIDLSEQPPERGAARRGR
ncbi:MAG: GntR family transcriptional regulator [Dongiaceae bacterium]